jgi:hypothetical protein
MSPSLFRLRGLSRTLLLVSGMAFAGLAFAQGNPIKVLVGFPPGGGTDAIARVLAERLKDQLGVPVIVENKAGAGGQLAAQALKAAAPDGNTLFLTHDHSVSILPLVMKNPGFDPAKAVLRAEAPRHGLFDSGPVSPRASWVLTRLAFFLRIGGVRPYLEPGLSLPRVTA